MTDRRESGRRSPRVRPYTITGGRTRARTPLALETLVQTVGTGGGTGSGNRPTGSERTICGLCVRPISVAEVAARSGLPLGVTRVLLDDMARAGHVTIHATAPDRPDRQLLERVLDGLQRL